MLAGFVRQRFAPLFPAPAELQCGIFERVNGVLRHRRKPGLERGEPVVRLPFESDGAERAASQLGQRVVSDGFTAVEKKRNPVAMKRPSERLVICVEIANEHGTVAEPVAGADEF
jgi:hypothetical protein